MAVVKGRDGEVSVAVTAGSLCVPSPVLYTGYLKEPRISSKRTLETKSWSLESCGS